jgi:hypothetical protein
MFIPNHFISLTFHMHVFFQFVLPTTYQPPSYLLILKHFIKIHQGKIFPHDFIGIYTSFEFYFIFISHLNLI